MNLSRRSFLGLLGAGAAGLALDPERLLWVPGAKKIFVPAPARVIAAHALMRGDIFTIAGRYAINPFTWEPVQLRNGEKLLQHFVVTEDVAAGREVLASRVTPSFTQRARDDEGWELHHRSGDMNGEALPPGDHAATPLGKRSALAAGLFSLKNEPLDGHRGFVLPPPDRRAEGERRRQMLLGGE